MLICSSLICDFREWAQLKYASVMELSSRVATSARQLIVVAAPVRGALRGVLFFHMLLESRLLACLWQLLSLLPNDAAVLTSFFSLPSSEWHYGLAVFPSLPLFFFTSCTRSSYLHLISLFLSTPPPPRRLSAL